MKSISILIIVMGILFDLDADQPTDVSFIANHDQTEQRYVIVLPDKYVSNKPHDVLICLHGHGSDRWQYIQQDRGETRAARDFARLNRMIFVSPDYRAKTSWMGPAAETDLIQIIDGIKKQYPVKKIILSGASMGGTSALSFAVLHPDLVDAIVALNGHANHIDFPNFQEAIQSSFGGTKTEIPEEYRKRSAEFFPERLTMPIAMTAGGKDTVVPPDSVVRLSKEVKKYNPFVYFDFKEDRGHETDYESSLAAYSSVFKSLAPKVLYSRVSFNGKLAYPAHGSASGIWFYTDSDKGSQLLLAGHTEVPESWQMTLYLKAGDEMRISFTSNEVSLANIQFQNRVLLKGKLECQKETNALVFKAGSESVAARLANYRLQRIPVTFIPQRRPFSRGPVDPSPDMHPVIANALIEWDWRMQDGVDTKVVDTTVEEYNEQVSREA